LKAVSARRELFFRSRAIRYYLCIDAISSVADGRYLLLKSRVPASNCFAWALKQRVASDSDQRLPRQAWLLTICAGDSYGHCCCLILQGRVHVSLGSHSIVYWLPHERSHNFLLLVVPLHLCFYLFIHHDQKIPPEWQFVYSPYIHLQ